VLGIVSGALGAFAVLRRQSLLGDAMSHAALPGIVLAFLLTRSKTPSCSCSARRSPAGSPRC
jgi:manganese/zinc/iron transport system permease protein